MLAKILPFGLILYLLSFLGDESPVNAVVVANSYIAKAQISTNIGNYNSASKYYSYLVDTLHVNDVSLHMNYANCLYKKGDLKRSAKLYKQVFRSTFASDALKSDALLQLGVLSQNEPEAALQLFKKALEINPFNETARYNYELTYLLLDMDPSFSRKKRANNSSEKAKNKLGEKNNEGSQGNGLKQAGKGNETPALTNTKDQDPRTSGMQAKAKADAEGQKNKNNAEAQVLVVNKNDLKDLNLSPEQAVQMLDAMQTAEIQYLQQAPRKRIKQNKAKGNYKDW